MIRKKCLLVAIFKLSLVYANNIENQKANIESQTLAQKLSDFYLGTGLGAGINFFSPTNTTVSANNPAHASFAWRLFAGYNINKNFALEIGYTNFGYYQNDAQGNSICDTSGVCGYSKATPFNGVFNTHLSVINSIQAYALDFSAIGRYPLNEQFNLFGRVGVDYLSASLDTNTTVNPLIGINGKALGPTIIQDSMSYNDSSILPLLGGGLEYKANDLVSLRLEYDYYFGSEMIDQQGINQGKLYPSAILFSTVIKL